MKLYEIERGSKILLPISNGKNDLGKMLCTFNSVDGMYSNISTPDGHTVHLGASADLVKVQSHYELAPNKKAEE